MRKRSWENLFKPIGVLVVLSMLLGSLPAGTASSAPASAGISGAPSPAPLLGASNLSLGELATLMEARNTPSPADTAEPSANVEIAMSPDLEYPIKYGTLATADPNALPSDAGPSTTWDKLKSKGSEKSNLVVDDEGSATPDKGGKLKTKDGWLTVEFPPGAVTETVKLKYKRAGNAPHPVLDSRDTYYAFGLLAETKDGKKITKFSTPITITLSYQEGSGVGPDAALYYWNEEGAYWSFVPSYLDVSARTIVATPDHMTDYALSDANQVEPDLPNLKDYATDLQTGAATVEYPIEVPPGRNGLQPQLSLNYNSQNKASNAGKYDQASPVGWDWTLNGIPYIVQSKQDTSSGAGIIYTLVMNGVGGELVKVGGTDDDWKTPNDAVARIKRVYAPPLRYWIVTTKDGTQYKLEDPWNDRPTRGINYYDPGSGACTDYVWRFSATVITDTVGNTMTLDYVRDTGTTNCRGTNYSITIAEYPDFIDYAGGKYRVQFAYSDPITYRSDYYSGSQQQAKSTLDEIKVFDQSSGSDVLIRKYVLSHGYFTTKDETGVGYTRLALNRITPYGESLGTLPATTFTYAMQKYLVDYYTNDPELRLLQKADSGYHGSVTYLYEDAPDASIDDLGNTYHTFRTRVSDRGLRDGNTGVYTYTYNYSATHVNSEKDSQEIAGRNSGTILRHIPYRDYRGHDWATEIDPEGNRHKFTYGVDDYTKGMPLTELQTGTGINVNLYITSTTTYITSTTNVSSYNTPWNRVYYYTTDKDSVVQRNYENTNSSGDYKETKVEYTYDANRNVKEEIYHGDTGVSGDEKTVYHEYFDDATDWIKDRPYRERVYAGIGTGGTLLSSVRYHYDNDESGQTTSLGKGLLTHTQVYTDSAHTVNTRYGYDSFGNQTVVTDTRGYATTTNYDTTYRVYPVKKTNTLGQETTQDYDWGFGKPTVITDANGNVTRYSYDQYGRTKKLAKPGDSLASPTIEVDFGQFDNQMDVGHQAFIMNFKGAGSVYQFFDGMGRVYHTISTGPDSSGPNAYVRSTKTFDEDGNVVREYLPEFTGLTSPPLTYVAPTTHYTEKEYDPIGRVKQVNNADGTTQYITYTIPTAAAFASGQKTYDENGHLKIYYRDIYGRLVQVKEYTGTNPSNTLYATTDYAYDLAGNLTGVEDNAGNATSMTYDWAGRKLSMSDVDMGSYTYGYDAAGNLTRQVDASGNVLNFQYDQLNRLTTQLEGATPIITYTYDSGSVTNGKGQRTGMQDASGSTTWNYSNRGKVSQEDKTISNINYSTSYTYDALERVATTTYPGGEVITNTYSSWGPLDQMTSSLGDTFLYDATYNALKLPTLTKHNATGSLQVNYQYFADNYRLKRIYGTSALANDLDLNYTYDSVGNVASFTDSSTERGGESVSFGYDSLDRLISATGAYDQAWAYDTIGNMTVFTRTTTPYNYTYGDSAHKHAATQVDYNDGTAKTDTYSYDARGNMTGRTENGITYTQTFNKENQLTQVISGTTPLTTTFLYDGDGQRVQKQVDDGSKVVTTMYVGNILERVYTTITNTVSTDIKYYYANGKRIAMRDSDGVKYIFGDHLGSTALVADASGNRLMRQGYFPYGELRYITGASQTDYGFTGQKSDDSTTLMYYAARYYDPRLGRFASADTIVPMGSPGTGCAGTIGANCTSGIGPLTVSFSEPIFNGQIGQENRDAVIKISSLDQQVRRRLDLKRATGPLEPQSLNRYSYVLDNPVKYVDPTGHDEPLSYFMPFGNGSYLTMTYDPDTRHYKYSIHLSKEDADTIRAAGANESDPEKRAQARLDALKNIIGPNKLGPKDDTLNPAEDEFLGNVAKNWDDLDSQQTVQGDGFDAEWNFRKETRYITICYGYPCGHISYDVTIDEGLSVPFYPAPGGR